MQPKHVMFIFAVLFLGLVSVWVIPELGKGSNYFVGNLVPELCGFALEGFVLVGLFTWLSDRREREQKAHLRASLNLAVRSVIDSINRRLLMSVKIAPLQVGWRREGQAAQTEKDFWISLHQKLQNEDVRRGLVPVRIVIAAMKDAKISLEVDPIVGLTLSVPAWRQQLLFYSPIAALDSAETYAAWSDILDALAECDRINLLPQRVGADEMWALCRELEAFKV